MTLRWQNLRFLVSALSLMLSLDTCSSFSATSWFPTRIQDTLQYSSVVERLYVRHILTETSEMAQEIRKMYAKSMEADPFGSLATSLSACAATRAEGGKIGWVERESDLQILPNDVIRDFFEHQPKAGDVYTIQCSATEQWHVIQCMEVWSKVVDDATLEKHRVGAFGGKNAVLPKRKLKGLGVTPVLPETLRTYTIQTTGCQMNVADSERLEGVLQQQMGMEVTDTPQQADLVLFNTCTIRDHAEQKLYDALGPYAAQKRKGKKMALIVTGCVAQQEGEALLRRIPEIDVVLGPQYVPFLQTVIEKVGMGEQIVVTAPVILPEDGGGWNPYKPVRGHRYRAWVNVIHGCAEHCTYCSVPSSRGLEVSRTMEAILQECLDLQAQGYREVTLLGQNVDAYGRDMVPRRSFAQLLEFLNMNLSQDMRIRYVTSHPRYFSERVIDAVANLDKVCECFHMPFQAGDNDVLKRMRRGYTYESYMKIINEIKSRAPDAAITADVIVGFPGETEEAFLKTLDLMKEVKFDNVNSFVYSPRPNTEAALFTDQVDEEVKASRLQRVQSLAAQHGLERSERYMGRTVEVLVEDSNPRDSAQVMGRTRQGRQVYFDGDFDTLAGSFVNVTITEARTWSLMGEMALG